MSIFVSKIAQNDASLSARHSHSLVVADANLFVIGGEDANFSWTNDLPICNLDHEDMAKTKWKKSFSGENSSVRRDGHVSVFYKNKIFVFGGSTNVLRDEAKHQLYVFDFEKEKWSQVDTSQQAHAPRELRRNHAALLNKNELVIFGGRSLDDQTCFNDLCVLNLDDCTWRKISSASSSSGRNAPCARTGHSLTVDTERNRAILFGGLSTTTNTYLNDLYALDLTTYEWSTLSSSGSPATTPLPRERHVAAVYDDNLFIAGGWTSNGLATGSQFLARLNLSSMGWESTEIRSTTSEQLFRNGRYGHSAVQFGNMLFMVGGRDDINVFNDFYVCYLDGSTSAKPIPMPAVTPSNTSVIPQPLSASATPAANKPVAPASRQAPPRPIVALNKEKTVSEHSVPVNQAQQPPLRPKLKPSADVSPIEKSPAPVKDTPTPVEDTPSPSDDAPTRQTKVRGMKIRSPKISEKAVVTEAPPTVTVVIGEPEIIVEKPLLPEPPKRFPPKIPKEEELSGAVESQPARRLPPPPSILKKPQLKFVEPEEQVESVEPRNANDTAPKVTPSIPNKKPSLKATVSQEESDLVSMRLATKADRVTLDSVEKPKVATRRKAKSIFAKPTDICDDELDVPDEERFNELEQESKKRPTMSPQDSPTTPTAGNRNTMAISSGAQFRLPVMGMGMGGQQAALAEALLKRKAQSAASTPSQDEPPIIVASKAAQQDDSPAKKKPILPFGSPSQGGLKKPAPPAIPAKPAADSSVGQQDFRSILKRAQSK